MMPGPDLSRQRADVVARREELGRTISQLADRVDVQARAREQTARLRARLRDVGPDLVLGAVALGSAVIATFAIARYLREPSVPTE
jgi:predicted nucleic acid-binding protein